MSSLKSKNNKKFPLPPVPRAMDEIQKVYSELCARAGALQYKITIDNKSLDELNEALVNVNNEAAARQQLDAKTVKESETK